MKKIYMINNAFWKIYLLIIITFFSPCLFSCTEHKDVEATIFDDVIQMDAEYGNGNFVFFNVPSGVEYLILGIFANPIEVDGKNIVNTYDLEGGSRSGLSGFSRTSVSLSYLYTFDEISKDFTTTNYIVPSGIDLYWAVWGYNKDWVLISATSQKIINFK